MRTEIIRPDGDLKREVWTFDLQLIYHLCIYFDRYSFQTRETRRHKWKVQTHWDRLNRRDNTIASPPLPPDVEAEVRPYFAEQVRALPIER